MPKSKCEQLKSDPIYTETDRTRTPQNTHTCNVLMIIKEELQFCLVVSLTWCERRTTADVNTPGLKPYLSTFVISTTWRCHCRLSKEVKYGPTSKTHTGYFMSPAICDDTGSEPPQCLRPVNALSLTIQNTHAGSYTTK